MPKKHLIIGSGSAGLSALEQIRRMNSEDEVKIVSMEDLFPYSPTVLPYLLSGKVDGANLPMRGPSYFDDMKVSFLRNKKVIRVLPKTKEVVYQDGERESYDALLIATGAEASQPRIKGLGQGSFTGFHTIADCRRLVGELSSSEDITILGAGLVGMEVAIGLVDKGYPVTIIEKEPRVLPLYFDSEAESIIRGIFLNHNVRLLTGREVSAISRENGQLTICLSQCESVTTDILVTCTGVTPRTEFITDAGIAVNQGILVDRRMRTNVEDIYAAGDVAEAPNFFTGELGMNPIILSAVDQGRIAGSNMVGTDTVYPGWISTNIFHFFGNTAFSTGLSMATVHRYEVLTEKDEAQLWFKRLVYDDDRLVGGMFINVNLDPGVILYLIEKKVKIGSYKQTLFEYPKDTSRWLMQEAERLGADLSRV